MKNTIHIAAAKFNIEIGHVEENEVKTFRTFAAAEKYFMAHIDSPICIWCDSRDGLLDAITSAYGNEYAKEKLFHKWKKNSLPIKRF